MTLFFGIYHSCSQGQAIVGKLLHAEVGASLSANEILLEFENEVEEEDRKAT